MLTQLTFRTEEEMNLVFKEALAVRTNTPYSFRDLPELQIVFSFEQQPKELVIK